MVACTVASSPDRAFVRLQMRSPSTGDDLDMVVRHFEPHTDILHANGDSGLAVNSDVICCASDLV